MVEVQRDLSQELRVSTDQSLEGERNRTDTFLVQQNDKVKETTDDRIRSTRLIADRERDEFRDSQQAPDNKMRDERRQADRAQDTERATEDRLRKRERLQKHLIAEALLESERHQTDSNLFDERVSVDSDSAQNLDLLSDEKTSHALTKIALVTRDQFLAVVSHDLKNPLAGISMSAEMLRGELEERDKSSNAGLLKYVDIIERSAANMDRMIGDLLDVERMANGKLDLELVRTDLGELLLECKELSAPVVANKAFTLKIEMADEPVFAKVDPDRILQVLANLIANAIKFTPREGVITLSLRRVEGEVQISVADNGPGIPAEKKTEIFERFSQLRSQDRRGLGLGLFISKWIVEEHGGRIWVTSQFGHGSQFTFTLK